MICKHRNIKPAGVGREWLVCKQRQIAMNVEDAKGYCKMCPSREDA